MSSDLAERVENMASTVRRYNNVKASEPSGEQYFNLPHYMLSPRELVHAYSYAANKWGVDSMQSRDVLDSVDKLTNVDGMNYLKGQVEELEYEIEFLNKEVVDNRGEKIDELEEKIDELEEKNWELKSQVDNLERQITGLEVDLERVTG